MMAMSTLLLSESLKSETVPKQDSHELPAETGESLPANYHDHHVPFIRF